MSDIDKILDDFAESIKEIQAERNNDVYYDRCCASQDIDEAYKTAKTNVEALIQEQVKQARLDDLLWIIDRTVQEDTITDIQESINDRIKELKK